MPGGPAATPGIPGTAPRALSGLGERFARTRPTAELRQLFLGAFEGDGAWAGQTSEIALLRTLLRQEGPAKTVFQNAGITDGHVQNLLEEGLVDRLVGDHFALLDAAESAAKKDGLGTMDTGHLLVVLLEKGKDGPLREMLARLGVNPEQVRDWVKDYRETTRPDQNHRLQESDQPPDDRKPQVEFRLAEDQPTEGMVEAEVEGTKEKVYLHRAAALTSADVAAAQAAVDPNNLDPSIEIRFNEAGAKKVEKLSGDNIGRRLAVVVGGKVISAPVIRMKIGDRAVIAGKFTKAEAEKLAAVIGGE